MTTQTATTTTGTTARVWIAKEESTCAYDMCSHAGRIRKGEAINWNRSEAGKRYHADCFLKVKGRDVIAAPKPRKQFVPVVESTEAPATAQMELDLKHHLYPLLKHYVAARQHTYLWGAPGSGKSHVADQIAGELGLTFASKSVNPQSPVSLLMGFVDLNGIYRESELFKAWRDGGVFLFDEMDNCSPSILTLLNGMLASNKASFPCGMVDRHPDFVFIATGNTAGRGGDYQFPARTKIDEASIDRLAFIAWDYDEKLELGLALRVDPNCSAWVKWIQCIRKYVRQRSSGVKGGVYCTQRAILSGAADWKMLGKPNFSFQELAERHVFKGSDPDTVSRVFANCPVPTSY